MTCSRARVIWRRRSRVFEGRPINWLYDQFMTLASPAIVVTWFNDQLTQVGAALAAQAGFARDFVPGSGSSHRFLHAGAAGGDAPARVRTRLDWAEQLAR